MHMRGDNTAIFILLIKVENRSGQGSYIKEYVEKNGIAFEVMNQKKWVMGETVSVQEEIKPQSKGLILSFFASIERPDLRVEKAE